MNSHNASSEQSKEESWYEFRLIFSDASKPRNWRKENYHFIKHHIFPIITRVDIHDYHVLNYFSPGRSEDFIRFRMEVSQNELTEVLKEIGELKNNRDITDFEYEEWDPRQNAERRIESVRQNIEAEWRKSVENKSVNRNWKLVGLRDNKYAVDETDNDEFSKKTKAFEIFMTRILGPWTKLFIQEMEGKPEDKWLLSLFIHLLINSFAYSGPDDSSEEATIRKIPPL